MNNIYKKTIVFFLGIIFTFCVSEVFFRTFYYFQSENQINITNQMNKSQKWSLLFLGNSHTFGAGVKKENAYPGVLQKFFDQNLKNSSLQVVVHNGGVPNANTFEIYSDLDKVVAEAKPNLAFIMSGEPNIWNKNGYNEYAFEKNKPPQSSALNFLVKAGEYSKTIRWVMSFRNLSRKSYLSEEQEDEVLVYKEIAAVEKAFFELKQQNSQSDRLRLALQRFIQKNENNPPKEEWRAVLYCLARLEFYTYSNPAVAFDLVSKSVQFQPLNFDMYSYFFLRQIKQQVKLNSAVESKAQSLFQQLQSRADFPGEKRIEEIYRYAIIGERAGQARLGLDYQLISESHNYFKIFTVIALESANYQRRALADYTEANITLVETFKANPFSFKGNLKSAILEIASEKNYDKISQQKAKEIIQEFPIRFPDEKYFFDQEHSEGQALFGWIRWDTIRIIQKMKELGVPLVVQNYHWIRDRAEAPTVNEANESAAIDQGAFFLDTHSSFMNAIKSDTADVESFFIQTYGIRDSHPSEKGHRVIAYIIYKYMVSKKLLPPELSTLDAEQILKIN